MATIPTPEQGKPILDFSAGTFDGNSNLIQSRNGAMEHVNGDDVADYVNTSRIYNGLETASKTPVGAINEVNAAIDEVDAKTGKILTAKLDAGETSITISDASITADCMILPYFQPEVMYNSLTPSVGSVVLTFDEQSVDINIKLEVK